MSPGGAGPQPPLPVGVVGAGTLGCTVVRAALAAGSSVTVLVRGGEARCRERAGELGTSVRRDGARRGASAEETEELLGRLRCTDRVSDLAGAEVVVEAVPEDARLKRRVLARLEEVVAAETVLASTTSSIPAAVLARGARCPERIVVAHYVWPAHRMPLVEVAFHDRTSPDAVRRLTRLLVGQGKRAVEVADRPGFLITRALFAYWDAAVGLMREGCPPARVDDALTGFGWPMGPFAVMTATGLPSVTHIHAGLAPWLHPRLPSLTALGAAVEVGASRFMDGQRAPDPRMAALLRRGDSAAALDPEVIVERTVGALAREVDRAVAEGVVASWELAGAAIDAAYGFPTGHGGLARWWREREHPVAVPDPAVRPTAVAPRTPADIERIERTPS